MAKRVIELLKKYPERNFFFAFGAGKCVINKTLTVVVVVVVVVAVM